MKLAFAVIGFATLTVGLSQNTFATEKKITPPVIQTAAQQNDWDAYRKEQVEKIRKNDERIAELKKQKANTDKTVNAAYQKRIDALQQKNTELRSKITEYKYNESKWEQFKREFNHDMDELGKSLKDIGKDNVK